MKVVEFLLDTLERCGVRHIFGNPGTTELPLVRAVEHRERIGYVVALSEISAVPMADGYARTKRALGVVNLHVAPGLGNGMGQIYTASIAQSPLLILVGAQDTRFTHTHPILHGPVREMAATVTKAVVGIDSTYSAAANIRRAIRLAQTPPTGPVALLCPSDMLEAEIDDAPEPVAVPRLSGLDAADARAFADFVAGARHPAIIVAEDVHWHGAAREVERLAGLLDCPVFSAPYTAVLPMASASRHYAGSLSPSRKGIAARLADHDAIVYLGGIGFRTTLYSAADFPQRKAWIGANPGVLASDGEFEFARVADIAASLRATCDLLAGSRSAPAQSRQSGRTPIDLPAADATVFHPSRAIHALLGAFRGSLWVDESGLSVSDMRQWIDAQGGEYVTNGSGGIGWGLPAACGVAIGNPDRQTVAVIGDGSALYASEGLWSAGHHEAKLLAVILSNRRYATLNEAASRLAGNDDVGLFRLEPPVLDFSGLATLYGFRYVRAETEAELRAFLDETKGRVAANTLLDLVFDPRVKPVTAARHF